MNKKFMLIAALILAAVFLIFIAWLVFRKDYQPASAPAINSDQAPVGSAGTITPSGQNNVSGQSGATSQNAGQTSSGGDQIPPVIAENFQWSRYLYYNDNADSQKVLKYLVANKIDEKLSLVTRDLKVDSAYLTELAGATQQCGFTGDPSSVVPLIYDRAIGRCYAGYVNIINYLNQELNQ